MGGGKRALLVIISFFLILSIVLLFFGILANNLLYPKLYQESFEKSGVYEYADKNLESLQAGNFLVISEQGFKPTIDGLMSNILSYVRGDTNVLNLTLQVNSTKLEDFFLDKIDNLPSCSQGQDPLDEDNPCLPLGKNPSDYLREFLEKNDVKVLQADTVDLTKIYGLQEGSPGRTQIDNLRSAVQIYKRAIYILGLAIIFLLALMFLLEIKSVSGFLRWVGAGALIAGIILFIPIYLAISRNFIDLPKDEIFSKIIDSAISIIMSKAQLLAGVVLALGIILLVSGITIARNTPKTQIKVKSKN